MWRRGAIALAGILTLVPPAAAPARAESAGGRAGSPARESAAPADPYAGLEPWLGDIHVHTGLAVYRVLTPEDPHSIGTPDEILDAAESRGLDFVVITEHSNNVNDPRGIEWRRETGETFTMPDGTITASEWDYLQAVLEKRNRPGEFVTMIGIEYTHGETETAFPGHQAAIFPTGTLPRYCSNFPHNAGDCPDHSDFFRFVKEYGGLAVMAHPCARWGHCDWSVYDPVVNSVELLSGKCEFQPGGYNHALKSLGLRVGARGSSDSHHFEVGNNDKTVCWARELTREAILDSMRRNLCYFVDRYAVTVRFSINGSPMGSEVLDDGSGIAIRAVAHSDWDSDFDHMDLIHDGEVVQSVICEDFEYDDCELATFLLSGTGGYYYVAVSSLTDRRLAISSPIWVRTQP